MVAQAHHRLRQLPHGLENLLDLALDMRWSWSHATDQLWAHIDDQLWQSTRNPWLTLHYTPISRLQSLSQDAGFVQLLSGYQQSHQAYQERRTWFEQAYPQKPLGTIAYFCMEFGLAEALPIYSGGLGMLAGDMLKVASDLGLPMLGVGLLYQQGYFRQGLRADSDEQLAFYPYNEPSQLPVMPVQDELGEWLHVEIELPGRVLYLRCWQVRVGRVRLYLLDSNHPLNSPPDRGITSQLYPGDHELRLQQELVLGIGGWRLLQALGEEVEICHLNEGHAAFAIFERARQFAHAQQLTFKQAWQLLRAGNVFTTHTPVEAGFDLFAPNLIDQYLQPYVQNLDISVEELRKFGRADPANANQAFNMAYFAVRGSGMVNAVSRLHACVSRRILLPLFPRWPQAEVPVFAVTNGVHAPSWDSPTADELWTHAYGQERWTGMPEGLEASIQGLKDEQLWQLRSDNRHQLILFVRQRLARQFGQAARSQVEVNQTQYQLDPNILTLGFARRFATYKRPHLLLHDPQRLLRLLTNPQYPVQIIVAGKAHPQDEAGKDLVKLWAQFARQAPEGRVIFLVDYDMLLAEQMVQGVDVWINTPRRPWEACGTSGMKVLVNGGLNLSELDGWWAEAYTPAVGWALGDQGEHDEDPAWDAHEAEQLYDLLENIIVPEFYRRDEFGIPRQWVGRIRASMAQLTPQFSANRMARDYLEQIYLPAAVRHRNRLAHADADLTLPDWQQALDDHWHAIHLGEVQVQTSEHGYHFQAPVYLDELGPEFVQVQLYADPERADEPPEVLVMERKAALTGAVQGYVYEGLVTTERAASDYTVRVVPHHPQALVPLENQHILWQQR